jgi:two-component system cell cycle sensor histidine kinase/response regulator CckA
MSQAIKKIMVMDDEEIVGDITRQMLMYLGYDVIVVADGKEAIQLYRDAFEEGKTFHAVIMDLNIPNGMGGREAVKEVMQIDADARILVASGYSSDPIIKEYHKYGFCGSIAKPFDLKELQDSIQSALQ